VKELGEAERQLWCSLRSDAQPHPSPHGNENKPTIASHHAPTGRASSHYCPANTNGTFAIVVPPEAGNCQDRTLLAMQLARPV
jgi:hypothetical protein